MALVIATTPEPLRVEAGEDGSTIIKTFHLKEDVLGKVIEWDGDQYAFRFVRRVSPT